SNDIKKCPLVSIINEMSAEVKKKDDNKRYARIHFIISMHYLPTLYEKFIIFNGCFMGGEDIYRHF
ncbi:MAG TPA: hypothetical protein VE524_03730, partial [Nitrososphaeraceae archaeon]|nr:hypothetical protein [Nitrososphaeraceae archaeon]